MLNFIQRTAIPYILSALMSVVIFFTSLLGIPLSCVKAPPEPVLPETHPIRAKDALPDTYAATDGLGRALPGIAEAGAPREGRFVGLFYWTWHVSHARWVTQASPGKPYNVNSILEAFPQASHDVDFPGWGPPGLPHHWNEPLFGYYDTDDRWVLRRHAELLANAGVDVLIFDNTNGTFTWKDSYDVLFEVFAEARAQGVNTPKISFLLPFNAGPDATAQLHMLYEDIYSQGRYQELWFYWKGRPLLLAYPNALDLLQKQDREIYEFFTFRPCNPAYNTKGSPGQWGWLSVYPQAVYYNKDGTPEQVTVGVAQNFSREKGLTAMNGENVFGRTYTSLGADPRPDAKLYGANFAQQWEYARAVDPEFVFITGFNEWVAGRFPEWMGVVNAFPDQCNDTYSRDIEPSKGDLADHYYYQLCDAIRRYKGVRALPQASGKKTIDIHAAADQWQEVLPDYYAYEGNTFDRDDVGYAGLRYTDGTGRNDITHMKVARDDDAVYFLAECAQDLTPKDGNAWMRLFFNLGAYDPDGWEGFTYVVNRASPGEKALLERSKGGWEWEAVGEVDYSVQGSRLQLRVPKALLGLEGEALALQFKWSDNMQHDGDVMDFYLHGDTAPMGRFAYQYQQGNAS